MTKKNRAKGIASAPRNLWVRQKRLSRSSTLHKHKLKQLKISLEDRLETIRALDAEILDALEDERGIEEEIEEAGDFSERVLEIVVEVKSVLSRKVKKKVEVVQRRRTKRQQTQPA